MAILAIAALFTIAGADPARGMPLLAAFGFWTMSVSVGFALAVAAAAGLTRWPGVGCLPRWQLVSLAGLIGLLLYTPLSLGFEAAFLKISPDDEDDGWLDRLERAGGLYSLAAELVQAGPLYLVSWVVLNIAPAAAAVAPPLRLVPVPASSAAMGADAAKTASDPPERSAAAPAEPAATALLHAVPPTTAQILNWPPALGDEVLSVSADLHYLHVRIALGRATVLGSLTAVETHFGNAGLRIHRSHWVARRAIRRVTRGANGWRCELLDGQRLPISRRRAAEVRVLLGRDFVMEAI